MTPQIRREFWAWRGCRPKNESPDDLALAAAKWAFEKSAAVLDAYKSAYTTDLFPEPPKGEHGKTIDSCSARMSRVMADGVQKEICQLAKDLSG